MPMTIPATDKLIRPTQTPPSYDRPGQGAAIGEGAVIAARLAERSAKADKLVTDDNAALTLPPNSVIGDVGDRVYFEASKRDGKLALKQIFNADGAEGPRSFAKAYTKQLISRTLVERNMPADEEAKAAGEAEKTRLAVIRVKNGARAAANVSAQIMAQMAAMGLNADKLSYDAITRAANELPPEIPARLSPADAAAAVRVAASGSPLTNRAAEAARRAPVGDAPPMTDDDWAELEPSAKETLSRLGFAPNEQALKLAREFARQDVPLTRGAMEKALVLSDGGAAETARLRQIAETRLRWAAESQGVQTELGRDVNLATLMEDIAKLRVLEQADMARALTQMGADATPANVSKMSDTFAKLRAFPFMTYQAFKLVTNDESLQTVRGVSEAVTDKYEASATVPSAKYGDAFRKIANQVSPLLESLNIEPTEPNVRAANILIKNNMDVTYANIADTRDIDAKVQAVYSRLHPVIAAKLVKENRAPADMRLDDLLDYIDDFETRYGTNDGDRLARYIRQLDTSGGNMDWQESREEVVSLYRALYRVSRDGGASLGLSLTMDEAPTLRGLSEQAGIYRSGRARFYTRKAVSDLIREIPPDAAVKLAKATNLNVSVEKAAELLRETPTETAESPQPPPNPAVSQADAARLAALEAAGIPAGPENARLLSQLSAPGALAKLLQRLAAADAEAASAMDDAIEDASLAALRDGEPLEAQAAKLRQAVAALPPSPEADEVVRVMRLLAAADATGKARRVPVRLNGKPTEARVYVVNGAASAEDFTVYLSLQTAFGQVSAAITAKGGLVDTAVQCDNREGAALIKSAAPKLAAYLSAEGFAAGDFALSDELERELYGL